VRVGESLTSVLRLGCPDESYFNRAFASVGSSCWFGELFGLYEPHTSCLHNGFVRV